MSCDSQFCFSLIRKTLPICCSSSNLVTPFLLYHSQFRSLNDSAPLSRSLLSGDSPEFPQKSPIPPPSFPLEIPQFSPPSGIPNFPPGPEFPKPPLPSPPGIDVPVPPHELPDIEPPWPRSLVPGPVILPPPPPEEVPPRPSGPEIVTSPSPPGSVPPMFI